MTDQALVAQMATISLYADMEESERAELAAGLRVVRFAAGETLMQQGGEPDGAYFVVDGRVRVFTKLPGGGEILIAELGPGSTIGELALIRHGRRGATVRAAGSVEVIFAEGEYFGAALAQLRPAAFKVMRQLALIQSARLRLLHRRIREAIEGDHRTYAPVSLPPPAEAPDDRSGGTGTTEPGFDYARFLPILPCFRKFDEPALAAVRERAEPLSVVRGTMLLQSGAAPDQCFVVVRGAIASGFAEEGRMHQLNVLGPGQFCALGPLLEEAPESIFYAARESALVLRLTRERFLELYLGTDRRALRLLRAVNEHQADMVSRANNHLTRLLGLSRLSRQLRAAAGIGVAV